MYHINREALFKCIDDFTNNNQIFKIIDTYLQGSYLPMTQTLVLWILPQRGLYSLSGRTAYGKISWSLEAAGFRFRLFQSLWYLTRISAATLQKYMPPVKFQDDTIIITSNLAASRLYTRFGGKSSYRLVNRSPVAVRLIHMHFQAHSIFS